jgi:glycosyltransferase involved in cell wall biosynthesis
MKVCAVVAAYNESETIAAVILGARQYVDKVFVIDDGSTDATPEIARSEGAHVIQHSANRGPGAAVQTGYAAAIAEGFDYVVQIDGDGQHSPSYVPDLLQMATSEDCDVVIGSRFLNDSFRDWPFVRRAGIAFFTKLVNLVGSTNITDVTSGFKVHKVTSLARLSRSSDRFPAAEQILEYAKKDMKIREVSVEMPVRSTGNSYLSLKRLVLYPFYVTWAIVKVMLFK